MLVFFIPEFSLYKPHIIECKSRRKNLLEKNCMFWPMFTAQCILSPFLWKQTSLGKGKGHLPSCSGCFAFMNDTKAEKVGSDRLAGNEASIWSLLNINLFYGCEHGEPAVWRWCIRPSVHWVLRATDRCLGRGAAPEQLYEHWFGLKRPACSAKPCVSTQHASVSRRHIQRHVLFVFWSNNQINFAHFLCYALELSAAENSSKNLCGLSLLLWSLHFNNNTSIDLREHTGPVIY